jgi:hypothetical protein
LDGASLSSLTRSCGSGLLAVLGPPEAAKFLRFRPWGLVEAERSGIPRCEHYLLRAVKGWTLADLERRRNGCRVWPAGERYGEESGSPAAIGHGDLYGETEAELKPPR